MTTVQLVTNVNILTWYNYSMVNGNLDENYREGCHGLASCNIRLDNVIYNFRKSPCYADIYVCKISGYGQMRRQQKDYNF